MTLNNINVVLGDSTDLLIASSDKGVISNGDKLINGKSDLAVKSFIVHKKIYYAGTHTEGLWRLALKSKLIDLETRSEFSISAYVFPNPMRSNSTIIYEINQNADVQIEIVYPNGIVYSSKKMKSQMSGKYQIKLSDFNLGTGVYYLRIKAKDKIEIKKLIII